MLIDDRVVVEELRPRRCTQQPHLLNDVGALLGGDELQRGRRRLASRKQPDIDPGSVNAVCPESAGSEWAGGRKQRARVRRDVLVAVKDVVRVVAGLERSKAVEG